MLSKMLRATRQNSALIKNTRNLLTTARRNFSSEESSLAASTPASPAAAVADPNSPVRNMRTL